MCGRSGEAPAASLQVRTRSAWQGAWSAGGFQRSAPFQGLSCRALLFLRPFLESRYMATEWEEATAIKAQTFRRIYGNSAVPVPPGLPSGATALPNRHRSSVSPTAQFFYSLLLIPHKYLLPQTLSQHLPQKTRPAIKSDIPP